MSPSRLGLIAFLLGIGLLGCDTTPTTVPDSQIVVEAYLEAQSSLPSVRLSRTVGARAPYNPQNTAVEGAEVVVERLDDDSTVVATVQYRERDSVAGLYAPEQAIPVRSQSTYRLRATPPDGPTVTSTTTVPAPVKIVETRNDTSAYQSASQPTFIVESPPRRSGRQNVYVFTTRSLLDFQATPDSSLRRQLTPFYADSFDPEEDSLESLRITSSGLLNEGNFERNDGGTITIELPWIAVAFFGPNGVGVNVVDDNYYDFLRSNEAQQQSFAPGEIPNVLDHVDGGTGIFGSYARASRSVFVRPPDTSDVAIPQHEPRRRPERGNAPGRRAP